MIKRNYLSVTFERNIRVDIKIYFHYKVEKLLHHYDLESIRNIELFKFY